MTPKQKQYAQHRATGRTRDQSAVLAGYGGKTVTKDINTTQTENLPAVQDEIKRIKKALAKDLGITREDVAEMFLAAYKLAKDMADPTGMVAAAREIGKLLGHYAPTKLLALPVDKNDIKRAMQEMSEEELYKLAHARTVDGESKRVPDQDVPSPSEGVRRDETEEVVLQDG